MDAADYGVGGDTIGTAADTTRVDVSSSAAENNDAQAPDARRLALQARLLEPLAARAREADARAARAEAAVRDWEAAASARDAAAAARVDNARQREEAASAEAARARVAERRARTDAAHAAAEASRAEADGARAARDAVVMDSLENQRRLAVMRAAEAIRVADASVEALALRVDALAELEMGVRGELAEKSARLDALDKEVRIQSARADKACAELRAAKHEIDALSARTSAVEAVAGTPESASAFANKSSSNTDEWKARALEAEEKLKAAVAEKNNILAERSRARPTASLFSPAPLASPVGDDLLSESRSRYTGTLPFILGALEEADRHRGDERGNHASRGRSRKKSVLQADDRETDSARNVADGTLVRDDGPGSTRPTSGHSRKARPSTRATDSTSSPLRKARSVSLTTSSADEYEADAEGPPRRRHPDDPETVRGEEVQEAGPAQNSALKAARGGLRASPRLSKITVPNMSDKVGLWTPPRSGTQSGKRKRSTLQDSSSPVTGRVAKRKGALSARRSPSDDSHPVSGPSPVRKELGPAGRSSDGDSAGANRAATSVAQDNEPRRSGGREMRRRKPVSYNYDVPGRDLIGDVGLDVKRRSEAPRQAYPNKKPYTGLRTMTAVPSSRRPR